MGTDQQVPIIASHLILFVDAYMHWYVSEVPLDLDVILVCLLTLTPFSNI